MKSKLMIFEKDALTAWLEFTIKRHEGIREFVFYGNPGCRKELRRMFEDHNFPFRNDNGKLIVNLAKNEMPNS